MGKNISNIVKASLIVEKNLWEEFKAFTKANNSDASKELRKFISNYVKKNRKKISK